MCANHMEGSHVFSLEGFISPVDLFCAITASFRQMALGFGCLRPKGSSQRRCRIKMVGTSSSPLAAKQRAALNY